MTRTTLHRRWIAAAAALLVLSGTAACTGSSHHPQPTRAVSGVASSGGTGSPIAVSGTRTLTGAEESYGASVGSVPGAVFKPDVVLIGGGANAIVGALDNGLVWTVKGDAPGVSSLAVGKIMAATAFATGRVEQVKRVGSDVQVLLAPVSLTNIFQQLHVSSSSPLTLAHPLGYSYANSPVASTDDGDAGTPAAPTAQPSAAPSPPPALHLADVTGLHADPPVPSVPSGVPTVSLPKPQLEPKAQHQGKFDLVPYCCFPSQGVHISYNEPTGRMAATVGIVHGADPLVDFHLDIDTGGLEEAVFEIHGPKAIEFQFDAATKDASGNYRSPTLRVPFAFTFPVSGIPFTVELTQSVRASIQLAGQAAFSSKGEYAISGGLGFAYRNGKFGVTRPSFSSHISSLQNAASFSAGINALSISYTAHISVGIGVLGLNAGLFVDLGATLAIDKDGSPPQTSLTAGCATAAVNVSASFGVGYTIPKSLAKVVNTFLSLFNADPIPPTGGRSWGPYTLWNPGLGKRCLQR